MIHCLIYGLIAFCSVDRMLATVMALLLFVKIQHYTVADDGSWQEYKRTFHKVYKDNDEENFR